MVGVTLHGTVGSYRKGCRCQQCRDANAAYMRTYRARTPVAAEKSRLQARAYSAAEGLLRDRHPVEFRELYEAELERLADERVDAVLAQRMAG